MSIVVNDIFTCFAISGNYGKSPLIGSAITFRIMGLYVLKPTDYPRRNLFLTRRVCQGRAFWGAGWFATHFPSRGGQSLLLFSDCLWAGNQSANPRSVRFLTLYSFIKD